MTNHRASTVWTLALLTLATAAPRPARADEVNDKVANFAREIERLLKEEKQTEVAVGEFTGPPLPKTSAGPLIQVALIEELKKRKVGINDAAFVMVKGEYFVLEDRRKDEQITIRLLATVRDKSGKKIDELSADIGYRGNDDIVKLLALTVDLARKPHASREDRNKKIKEDLNTPPLHLDGKKIKPSKDSVFAVEVLVKGKGDAAATARTPTEEKGNAFVDVQAGETYELTLTNGAKFEAAVTVTIDGVDAFAFFEGAGKRPSRFLVAAGETVVVRGWPRNSEKKSAFLVGRFADSAASKALKGSASLGTITVCFHPSWEVGKTPPEFKGTRSAADRATTFGEEIEEQSELQERTVGPLLSAVSIRYKK